MSFVCHSKKPSLTFFFGATASLPATAEKPASAAGRFRARGAERGGGSYLARSLRFVAPPVARTNARGARGSWSGCRRLQGSRFSGTHRIQQQMSQRQRQTGAS